MDFLKEQNSQSIGTSTNSLTKRIWSHALQCNWFQEQSKLDQKEQSKKKPRQPGPLKQQPQLQPSLKQPKEKIKHLKSLADQSLKAQVKLYVKIC